MSSDVVSPLAPGIVSRPGVVLPPVGLPFLLAVRSRLPDDFPVLVVTSGDRTPAEQARAMIRKYGIAGATALRASYGSRVDRVLAVAPVSVIAWAAELAKAQQEGEPVAEGDPQDVARAMLDAFDRAGRGELLGLYGEKARPLFLLKRTVESWGAYIAAQLERGIPFSLHLRPAGATGALDLSVDGLSRSQVNALIYAAQKTGARPLVEQVPRHLHLDRLPADPKPAAPTLDVRTLRKGDGLDLVPARSIGHALGQAAGAVGLVGLASTSTDDKREG